MAKVLSPDTLGSEIRRLEQRIALLENSQRSAVAVVAADPANPRNGDTWNRTSDSTVRVRLAGTTKTIVDDPGWQTPTLLNSWVDYGSVFSPTLYRRLNGVVFIKGLVKLGTVAAGTIIFTLPAGYRPAITLLIAAVSNDLFAQFRVDASGNVITSSPVSNVYLSLQCSFAAEQ